MIPFNVNVGGKKVGIHWESLIWFFIVTAGATIVGELIYDKWVSPYLADLPNLPGTNSVVSSQTPTIAGFGGGRRRRMKTIVGITKNAAPNLPA